MQSSGAFKGYVIQRAYTEDIRRLEGSHALIGTLYVNASLKLEGIVLECTWP